VIWEICRFSSMLNLSVLLSATTTTMNEHLLYSKRDAILRIASMHGAYNVRVFGSLARGEADERSDVDILVSFEEGRSLLDHAALWLELQELLQCRVDVVNENGIKERIRSRVLQEAIAL